jgi:hypothetical protein
MQSVASHAMGGLDDDNQLEAKYLLRSLERGSTRIIQVALGTGRCNTLYSSWDSLRGMFRYLESDGGDSQITRSGSLGGPRSQRLGSWKVFRVLSNPGRRLTGPSP